MPAQGRDSNTSRHHQHHNPEASSAIDTHQDGIEGLLVPDHVDNSVFAKRLSRLLDTTYKETDIPIMTPEGPSRSTSSPATRAPSPTATRRPVRKTGSHIKQSSMDDVVLALEEYRNRT